MILPAKVWSCDYCPAAFTQDGPRGAALPPIPPLGWFLVDVSRLVPAGVVSGSKVGEYLDTTRRTLCPGCAGRLSGFSIY